MKRGLVLFVILLTGCATSPVADLRGTWGGDGATLTIAESVANFLFNCGDGKIPDKFVVDSAGNFDLIGTFDYGFCSQGLSVQIACEPGATPVTAQYSGHVSGNVMSLTVSPADFPRSLEYTLIQGAPGNIGAPCP